ncbi:hypothetical protein QBC46DRAFT_14013 [Diplogelasinospora grovesii]|uniref:Endoplasmic reticulum junction formation protein lunapark n=1 Tax=Diplogelasinospora grovesii TaxID=303347 RepID=A0AAN6S8I0_9PEZI|nr:hypothetical protein QBC46DRAFT_14013 [Diplogelasinospora grovesii]
MVSFWPWRGDDASPASFEKALSALSTKIATTEAQLDQARSSSRRVKALCTLYVGFSYLIYAILVLLVVGWKTMGAWEWTGMAGGPVILYMAHTITTAYYGYLIDGLSARLKDQQAERAKTIQKLKDATRYDSTQELLEKYGGSENKAKDKKEEQDGGHGDRQGQGPLGPATPQRTNMPPPPTANIVRRDIQQQQHRPPASGPGTPQPPASRGAVADSPPQAAHVEMGGASAEFAANAFDGPESARQYTHHAHAPGASAMSFGHHWYDRILDTLLGEDETAAKNRIVLLCKNCRLVNGRAPPGTKSLAEVGTWKCMACGAMNGEMDEGKRIVQEVLEQRHPATTGLIATPAETTDEENAKPSSPSKPDSD